jgi:opacity protein-like surface antigen
MRRLRYTLLLTAVLTAGGVTETAAQLHITPAVGVFIPASDLEGVRAGAQETNLSRSGTMALGFNLDMGWLRGSLAYASGASISREGTQGDVGDGSVLAAAADLVLRPLPRLLVQPYVLGGVGIKRLDYSFRDDGLGGNPFAEDRSDLALHVGVGADLMLGGFGIMAEITDYIGKNEDDKWGQHDAFLMVGLRVRLGGGR